MVWQALLAALMKPVFYIAALVTSWFGGRKSAQADIKLQAAEGALKTALRAEEIESEIEALSHDDLKSRARKWVRKTDR